VTSSWFFLSTLNGVSLDGAKCFDQLIDLKKKKFGESGLNVEDFIGLLAHRKWGRYFGKLTEKWPVLMKIVEDITVLCHYFSYWKSRENFFIRVSTVASSLLSENVKIKIHRILILPAVLYEYETWSLSLRKERRLRMFENRVLRGVFGPKRDEVTG